MFQKAKENISQIATSVRLPEIAVIEEDEEKIPKKFSKKEKLAEELSKVRVKIQEKEEEITEEKPKKIQIENTPKKEEKKSIFPFASSENSKKIELKDIKGNTITKQNSEKK